MPGRLEFETEHDNEAEQYVKDMVFTDEDTPEEVDLKLTILEIYNSKLIKRAERKNFIHERGMLEYRKNQAAERKRPREERDLYNKSKVFARMQTAEDYEIFVGGLINEMRLRKRIAELQEYRVNGITTLSAGAQYEKDNVQRQNTLQQIRVRENVVSSERLFVRYGPRPSPALETIEAASPTKLIPVPPKIAGRKPAAPLDLQDADGLHLLTAGEQELCSALRIMPRPYLVIKETLLKEYAKSGTLRRRKARELVKIDVNKTGKVYDFFVDMGWIKFSGTAPGTPTAGKT